MRRKTAAVGAILVLVALFLYFSPSVTTPLAGYLGSSGTETVFDRNSVVTVPPLSYSSYPANLTLGDSLTVSLSTHPGNIDVLLMNQGNFSLWASGSKTSYSTYPESSLNVSTYSFTFTDAEKTQTFYVVLVSHAATESTEVLIHAVGTRPSESALLLFPVAFGLVGILVLGVSLRGGGPSKSAQGGAPTPSASEPKQAQAQVSSEFCRHCGAALQPGSNFCPSCKKSQL